MRIEAIVTVDVDEVEWANAFGCDEHRVQPDVISYIRTTLQGATGFGETDATVRVKGAM
jgi:hypothetical protein